MYSGVCRATTNWSPWLGLSRAASGTADFASTLIANLPLVRLSASRRVTVASG